MSLSLGRWRHPNDPADLSAGYQEVVVQLQMIDDPAAPMVYLAPVQDGLLILTANHPRNHTADKKGRRIDCDLLKALREMGLTPVQPEDVHVPKGPPKS